ncbi:MAG TPA: CPBP family glutamic-type intramembrane protease [Abditibacteriaceae bacterium]|nr:CPBP family glutamic-type intramembrane protease [Abditibacteriaceae bacterium]
MCRRTTRTEVVAQRFEYSIIVNQRSSIVNFMLPRFHPFLRLIFFVVGALVVQGLVGGVIFLALDFAARVSQNSPAQAKNFLVRNQLLLTLLVYPPTLLWLWFCRRAFDRQTFVSLGLRARGAVSGLGWGALCGVLTIGFLFAILAACGFVRINGLSSQWQQAGPRAVGLLAFHAFAFCCVGLTEEIVFRGYTLHNLSAWMGVRAAIWFQAILFGLVHLSNLLVKPDASGTLIPIASSQLGSAFWDARWGIVNIILIGVFFALAFLKTGSLWFPIGFHAAWNFFLGCIFSLPVSGLPVFRVLDVAVSNNTLATGGSFGAEGSVFLVALIGIMIWMMRREPDHAQTISDLSALRPDILTSSQTAENTTPETTPADAVEEDDPTHVPRFRTSMRPASLRPTLELGNSGSGVSSTRSGFDAATATVVATPVPTEVSGLESWPSETTLAPFSPLFPAATTEETAASVPNPVHETVLPATSAQDVEESVFGAKAVPIAQPVEVQQTASSPAMEQSARAAEKRQPVVTVEQSQPAPQPTTPPKPKKAAPKW